jgi:chromosome segregation ATPase
MCRISVHNKMSELLNRNTDPLFEKMEKIFAERDAEYKKMEERNRMREEAVKEKENCLKKQEEQFGSREANIRQQEKEIEEKMQMLEERQRETQEMEKYLQKKRLELEADEQQSLLDTSILREEIRNEKLKQQRLSRELEDKLADLGYSSHNLADPAILEEKEQKIKEQAQEIQRLSEEIEKWEDKADEWEEKESGFVAQIDTLNKEKAQLWKKLMGVDDAAEESLAEQEENISDEVEQPVEEKDSENEESVQEVEEVEVVSEEESVYAKEEENLEEAIEMDTPLTAEGFYNYLQEQEIGGVIQLLHAKQGDMVNIAISQIVVTVVFAENGWFDIKKSIGNNNRKLRRLIRSWNSSQNDLTFKYDTSDNTVTAEGDFDKDQTAEELLRYLDRLLDTYFDTGEEE